MKGTFPGIACRLSQHPGQLWHPGAMATGVRAFCINRIRQQADERVEQLALGIGELPNLNRPGVETGQCAHEGKLGGFHRRLAQHEDESLKLVLPIDQRHRDGVIHFAQGQRPQCSGLEFVLRQAAALRAAFTGSGADQRQGLAKR